MDHAYICVGRFEILEAAHLIHLKDIVFQFLSNEIDVTVEGLLWLWRKRVTVKNSYDVDDIIRGDL